LIEDPALAAADVTIPVTGLEITVCSGPRSVQDSCPLVLDGSCPACVADVVVSALDGPWASPVLKAWSVAGVPVVDGRAVVQRDPAARLGCHIGAALAALAPSPPDS
jgi:hypothetical protein